MYSLVLNLEDRLVYEWLNRLNELGKVNEVMGLCSRLYEVSVSMSDEMIKYNNEMEDLRVECDTRINRVLKECSMNLDNEKRRCADMIENENRNYKKMLEDIMNMKISSVLTSDVSKLVNSVNDMKESVCSHSRVGSLKKVGNDGEELFNQIAGKAFSMNDDFVIEDMSSKKHMGDYHLHFKDFTVVVDVKNYTNNVPSIQRKKLADDLRNVRLQNNRVRFAWLVSLNSNIDVWDKAEVMSEWVGDMCIFYVNSLVLGHNEPERCLRSVYYLCKEYYALKMRGDDSGGVEDESKMLEIQMEELRCAKKRVTKLEEDVRSSIKMVNEYRNRMVNFLEGILIDSEEKLLNEQYIQFVSWWNKNIVKSDGELSCNTLWDEFKKDGYDSGAITLADFRKLIVKHVSAGDLVSNGYGKMTIKRVGVSRVYGGDVGGIKIIDKCVKRGRPLKQK